MLFLESPDGQLVTLVTLGSVGILQLLTLHYALDGKFYLQQVRFRLFCLFLLFIFLLRAAGYLISTALNKI